MYAVDTVADLPVLLLHNLDPAWTTEEIDDALRQVAKAETSMRAQGYAITSLPVCDLNLAQQLRGYGPGEYVVFNWCEDVPGVSQGDVWTARVLEALGYCFTGSSAEVLALSWDKPSVKRLLDRQHIPTPRWRLYETPELDGWDCYPAIVKPAREHCSLGVTPEAVVLTADELQKRVAYVLAEFDGPALVEDFIDGREMHVSLVGNGFIEMLPPAEMDFAAFGDVRDRLCTFDSKFEPGSLHYEQIHLRVPAPLEAAELQALQRTALAAYHALGCRDYARLDIRLRDGVFYVLDINPNADIGAETSTACAAEAAGYSYAQLIGLLVDLAARRHPVFGAGRH